MKRKPSIWTTAIQAGALAGTIALFLALVGIVVSLGEKYIISGVTTMGQILVVTPMFVISYITVRRVSAKGGTAIALGLISGFIGGAILAALIGIGRILDLRVMFVNASPELFALLTYGLSLGPGILALLGVSMLVGALGAGAYFLPSRIRTTLFQAVLYVVLIGLLRDLIMTVISRWGAATGLVKWMFELSGLNLEGALFLFVLVGAITYWRAGLPPRESIQRTDRQKKIATTISMAMTVAILLVLPPVLGTFFSDILDNVGIYILMGLGLNIVVGFAGLLDLGYVAFYAIGAYMMGVLTSPELNANPMTYWQALPFAVSACFLAGVILGLPVLKMRGDYLAIVTLGFGEIVRLLVLSDWLRPWLGGTQGIQHIAHPVIGPYDLGSQEALYYVILVAIGIVSFIAWRLKDSRLGRSWMALREDEDVAKAMGINHVTTKLLAFATGAFFAGLSGTLFAAKLSSAYPQSFQFLVSINVLALLIVGGMGSIPGVLIGGLFLMGLPDILREFAEFRYLVYGAVLVAMMLTRPEGLWPEARRRLELHEEQAMTPGETPPSVLKNPGQ